MGQTTIRLDTLLGERAKFLSFLERRVGSRELAEEILQEAFVRGLERIEDVRADESVVPWFYRLLRNAVVEVHRRRAANARASAALANEAAALEAAHDEVSGELCSCMSGLIDALKPEYADAIRSVDLGGRSLTDLATDAGITTNNATVRLHRARQALGRELRATCGACADHGCLDCGCKKSHGPL
jgi:RNA polymerase sigma-70 factor (ECF subfamily)